MSEPREASNGAKKSFNKYFHRGAINQMGKIEKPKNKSTGLQHFYDLGTAGTKRPSVCFILESSKGSEESMGATRGVRIVS